MPLAGQPAYLAAEVMSEIRAETELGQSFGALADPTRLQILALLSVRSYSAGALGHEFTISAPALSRHLKILRQHGFVAVELDPADQRSRIYRLQAQPLRTLEGWLTQLQGQWQQQLEAFAQHVESRVGSSDS